MLLEAVLLLTLIFIALNRNWLNILFSGDLRMLKMLTEIAEREFFGHFLPPIKAVSLWMILTLVVLIRISSDLLVVSSR